MRNPAFWARSGLLCCLFTFAAVWCAGANALTPAFSSPATNHEAIASAAQPAAVTTTLSVANSQAKAASAVGKDGAVVHAIPTLDGFGLFIVAALLGVAALWLWRRRQ
jgi:hypothetical protein